MTVQAVFQRLQPRPAHFQVTVWSLSLLGLTPQSASGVFLPSSHLEKRSFEMSIAKNTMAELTDKCSCLEGVTFQALAMEETA